MSDAFALMSAAERGSRDAQEELGQLFLAGDGVPESISMAVYWLRRAAKQGHADAQLQLGILCAEGYVEAQTDASNLAWLTVAKENAHELANAYLQTFYVDPANGERSVSEIVRLWREQAKLGDKGSQARLGRLHWLGFGVEEDAIQAERWLRSAADEGPASAKYSLGDYLIGIGSRSAAEEGIGFLRAAADEGYSSASEALGRLFQVRDEDDPYTEDQASLGVRPDNSKAARYFRLAASQGSKSGEENLFYMMKRGEVVPTSDCEEASWAIAASGHSSQAQEHLADMYESGRGVEKDIAKADQLRKRARTVHGGPIRIDDL